MSNEEKSQEEIKAETAEFMKNAGNITKVSNIPVTPEQAQKIKDILTNKKKEENNMSGKSSEELETELEAEKTIREDYESKLKLIGEQRLAEKQAELRKLGYKGSLDTVEQVISAQEHLGLRQKKEEGGKGSIPMTQEMLAKEGGSGNNPKEFDNYEEMVEWCRVNDKEAFEKLKAKAYGAIAENKSFFEWKDTFTKDEKGNDRSLVGRTIDKMNAQEREKRKKS